jgi:hypothetical protein
MAKPTKLTKAIAYLRTSSAANVGSDKDSDQRQRAAIEAFAKRAGLEITEEFYDQDVSGADPIESRPGFSALLDRIESNGVRTVVVEDASRFARKLIVQEAGIIALIERGVRVLTSSGDDLTETSDPFKIAMRQIAGVFAQLEKRSSLLLAPVLPLHPLSWNDPDAIAVIKLWAGGIGHFVEAKGGKHQPLLDRTERLWQAMRSPPIGEDLVIGKDTIARALHLPENGRGLQSLAG